MIITVSESTISVVFPSDATYIFDRAGRPVGLCVGERYYTRGLGGNFKQKGWEGPNNPFARLVVDVPEKTSRFLLKKLKEDLLAARRKIDRGSSIDFRSFLKGSSPNGETPSRIVDRLLDFLKEKRRQDEAEFKRMYGPITILPPDQYFSIVLQIAEGCPWNKCTFCEFYRGRPFRRRSVAEVRDHIKEVRSFFKEGATLRKSIFLADANAMAVSTEDLTTMLEDINLAFPENIDPQGGIYSFGDVPSILKKTETELKELQKRHLRRIYVGMETGSDKVRRLIRKQGSRDEAVEAVRLLKSAGLQVGLILLLGIGGAGHEEGHVRDSVKALNEMPLGHGDILYFSPLDKNRMESQYRRMTSGLVFKNDLDRPVVAVYDIREFLY